jgi:uncharacterized protein (TIGR03435 family)
VRHLILSAALLGLTVTATIAQSPPTEPRFQVASVRVAPASGALPDGFAKNPRRVGDRWSWTTDLHSLVRYAYHLPGWRLSGIKPLETFYRIEASVEATATLDDVRSMLRQLLIERFKLTSHTRTEQRSGYALVVVDQPRLQRAAAIGEIPAMPDYLKTQPAAAFEGATFVSMDGIGIAAITGRGVPLARLAETLSEELKEFVTDETRMTGNFYFGFTYRRVDAADVGATEATPIFDALREALGLRLDRRKGPVEFLVVDRAERIPSEN